jgi:hypothetical protein
MENAGAMRRLRYAVLLALLFTIHSGSDSTRVFAIGQCSEACSLTAPCHRLCYDGPPIEQNLTDCEGYELCESCGNNYCNDDQGEDPDTCAVDCDFNAGDGPDCGDESCEAPLETSASCPQDCDGDPEEIECGDGTCDVGEDQANCFEDCMFASACTNDPEVGTGNADCGDWHGPSYICQGSGAYGRCVYAPYAAACNASLQGLDCPDPNMKCLNGTCVEKFPDPS